MRQEGTDAVGKEVEKTAQTPAVSAAPVSEGRLPNTGTDESVASLVAGILAAGLASAVLDDQKKEPIRPSKTARETSKNGEKFTGKRRRMGKPTLFT